MRTLKVFIDGVEHEVKESVQVTEQAENARTTFDFDTETGVVDVFFFDEAGDDADTPFAEELLDLTQMWETGTREY